MTGCGAIHLITGCMFSGKTTELIRRIRHYTIAKKECLVLNYKGDGDRFHDDANVVSHDGVKWQSKLVRTLTPQLLKEIVENNYVVIGINEGQFFSNLRSFCNELAQENKIVIVTALNGTFNGMPWPSISDLIPLCDTIEHKRAICLTCGNEASFTKRNDLADNRVEVIGTENYTPVCRLHFLEYLKMKPINENTQNNT